MINKTPFDWICPFCNKASTISNVINSKINYTNKEKEKILCIIYTVRCPSLKCNEIALYASRHSYDKNMLSEISKKEWQLIPNSSAKKFPDYIPKAILEDYREACCIVELSPKSAATLSRRCLQGMIRDFWKIRESSLYKEIDKLQEKIDNKIWKGIDALRKLGNIGAHMEKDVDLIIKIDENEAQCLIKLIECLFKEWYIKHHENEKNISEIIKITEEKGKLKQINKIQFLP